MEETRSKSFDKKSLLTLRVVMTSWKQSRGLWLGISWQLENFCTHITKKNTAVSTTVTVCISDPRTSANIHTANTDRSVPETSDGTPPCYYAVRTAESDNWKLNIFGILQFLLKSCNFSCCLQVQYYQRNSYILRANLHLVWKDKYAISKTELTSRNDPWCS